MWSRLEYACHVRDVHELFAKRVRLMLDEDDPTFENWDQDATAVEQAYDLQDPGEVGTELVERAAEVAAVYASVAGRPVAAPRPAQQRLAVHRADASASTTCTTWSTTCGTSRGAPSRRRSRRGTCEAHRVLGADGGGPRPGVRPLVGEQHVLRELDGRTVLEALAAGEPPKVVWRAVWAELELPGPRPLTHVADFAHVTQT